MKAKLYNWMKKSINLALVSVITIGLVFSGFLFDIDKAHAAEISYLITTTGLSCGLGTDEETLGAQGSSDSTKDLTTTGHSWNKTETARSITSGDWTVYVDITHSGSGGNRNIDIYLRRMNSSCVEQESILTGTVTPSKGGTGEYSYTGVGVAQIDFSAGDILLLELDPRGNGHHTLNYNGSGTSYDSRISSPDETSGATLGVTAPTNVQLGTADSGATLDMTFAGGELVTATDGGAGWTLSVISTALTDTGTIPASSIYLRKDGDSSDGGGTYTIWSGVVTGVSESSGTLSLDSIREVGTKTAGAGDETNVRPSIQIVIPPGTSPGTNYNGDITFTIA